MSGPRKGEIKAALFDKDGTLFDFRKTWEPWAAQVLATLSGGDPDVLNQLTTAVRFDLQAGAFHEDSLVIAGTNAEVAEVIAQVLTARDAVELEAFLVREAEKAPLASVMDLSAFCTQLRSAGLKLGVMTNDSFSVAQAHLGKEQVTDHFDLILGADSGFGAKPSPSPLLEFCRHVGVDPSQTIMVGDSTHDLEAGQAAGMPTVGVLTGMARSAELAPYADVVLNDISELPEWLQLN